MHWLQLLADFFAGAFLVNGVPHFVQGLSGHRFQTPFANPPGVGESSALVNVLWGWFNLAAGALLLWKVAPFHPDNLVALGVTLLGGALISLYLATHFGKIRGR